MNEKSIETMRAVTHRRYGPPEDMELATLPRPKPRRGEILVRVRACGLNASDWEFKTGWPGYARVGGLFRPRKKVLGSDVAGTVEAVGSGVRGFRPGDPVLGDILEYQGGLAEYVAAPAKNFMEMPGGMDFVTAAAIPQAAVVAHQGLTQPGPLPPGARVLINGAGGGAGTFAIQMAKAAGLKIGAVDTAQKAEAMRALGAHETFDYRVAHFSDLGLPYHRIIDLVATKGARANARALVKGGAYWAVGGRLRSILSILIGGRFVSGKSVKVLAVRQTPEALRAALPLIERGVVVPKIDRVFPLEEAPKALRRLGDGKAFGKVVISVT